jgi:hypothetical protein
MSPPNAALAPAPFLPIPAQRDRRIASLPIWCAIALGAWLMLRVFCARIGHDESQYVAGADLALRHTIFRDYLSLQPPMQSWIYAPVALMFPGNVFLAMRLLTALLGLATVVIVYLAQRSIGVGQRPALLAAGSMAAVDAFQQASSVVRNDILPAFFLGLALWAALNAVRRAQLRLWFVAGIAFGFAASTKLSYLPFGIAAGAFTMLRGDRAVRQFAACTTGLGLGVAPALLAWAGAPGSFLWGVLTYGATAPVQWYRGIGQGWELSPFDTAEDLIGYLLLGPALLAFVIVGARLRSSLATAFNGAVIFLGIMILAGVVGMVLPLPAHSQYVIPVLPPLFISLGIALSTDASHTRLWVKAILAFALVGMTPSLLVASRAAKSGSPILVDETDAAWMRSHLPAARPGDEIASFSPERAVDSGVSIDDDFATGPFVFRSGALLRPRTASELHVVIPANLEQVLGKRLPLALLTGYESPEYPGCLDAYLDVFAQRHGYRQVTLPDGVGRLYLRPKAGLAIARPGASVAADLQRGCNRLSAGGRSTSET